MGSAQLHDINAALAAQCRGLLLIQFRRIADVAIAAEYLPQFFLQSRIAGAKLNKTDHR